jgi:hypothetical protein
VVELVMLEVIRVALFSWWTSEPSGDIVGAPESAASRDIFLCPGSFGLTSTRSCVGTGTSDSFLVTWPCLGDEGESRGILIGSEVSRESFLDWLEGVGEGDSSCMVGGALRPLVGLAIELSFCFDFLMVTLFLTDCLQLAKHGSENCWFYTQIKCACNVYCRQCSQPK